MSSWKILLFISLDVVSMDVVFLFTSLDADESSHGFEDYALWMAIDGSTAGDVAHPEMLTRRENLRMVF